MTTFIFGEAMLEFLGTGTDGFRFGGDTLNTAIHLARAGHEVAYVTALGTDPMSDALIAAWCAEGIDTRYVLRHPERQPGIYAINLDDRGERSFLYWRDQSAARAMFTLEEMGVALEAAFGANLLYFSLIALAIIEDAEGRERLLRLAEARKAAGRPVAYDSNFRPQLWSSLDEAREASWRAMQGTTIGLPTDTDECAIWGTARHPRTLLQRWQDADVALTVLKAGAEGCYCARSGAPDVTDHPASSVKIVDTSGAGDAFNGGFLAAWLDGREPDDCIATGQSLAARTLQHNGAVLLD